MATHRIVITVLLTAGALSIPAWSAGFDVASVKPANPDARGYAIRPQPGRLVAENVTLQQLIAEAWHVYEFQISGPKWTGTDRYNLEAKVAGDGTPTHNEMRRMLQPLLADRFALKIHREKKEMAVYTLEPDRGGPKVEKAKHPENPVYFRVFQRRQITAENAPLSDLSETLTWLLGKPVLDRTGLEGAFDYKLEWSPDEVQVRNGEAPPEAEGLHPSLAAVLKTQLGLKLVARKEAVDYLVVEKAEKPSLN